MKPKLLSTYLPDGTLEGLRIIELSDSLTKAIVIPRIKLAEARKREEINQPALYLLISSGDNQVYIGESENFIDRIKNHDQSKDFWDVAIAIVSSTNNLEKSDVKYLESLAVEKAKETGAMEVLNKTISIRNNIHEFKVHSMLTVLEDTALVLELLGYSLFVTKKENAVDIWYCNTKNTNAKAVFRGDNFVVLTGSIIDKTTAPSLDNYYPNDVLERNELLQKFGVDKGTAVELTENIPFKNPNKAGIFVTGRHMNAWTTWKNKDGKTMDTIMRKTT